MKRLLMIALCGFVLIFCGGGMPVNNAHAGDGTTRISMTAGETVILATLDDSVTSQEFLATLPRTMPLSRYGDREYYGKVGTPLSEDGVRIPDYSDGDVTYYVPGGSFAVFFDKEESESLGGLIRMGWVDSDLRLFDDLPDSVEMRIEKVK